MVPRYPKLKQYVPSAPGGTGGSFARVRAARRSPYPGRVTPTRKVPVQLACRDVCVRFGGIAALDGVSFEVPGCAIVGIIGPNGAGKTTLFNCISGLCPVQTGDIRLDGESLLAHSAHQRARLGIGRTFQNVALFESMTAAENVMVAAHAGRRPRWIAGAVGARSVAVGDAEAAHEAEHLLELVGLRGVASSRVAELPFGVRKRVEVARALAGRPRLVLLDEPVSGLNHSDIEGLMALVRALRDDLGLSVLLVEHNMNVVMGVSDRVVVLDFGRVIADAAPDEVRAHPDVIRAYLGSVA
jgi:branched-chain amino acid transport system ATP-binding protein